MEPEPNTPPSLAHGQWVTTLRRAFGTNPFTVDEARRALGPFAPHGILAALRSEGLIELMDDGRMCVAQARLAHWAMGSDVSLDALDDLIADAARKVRDSARLVRNMRSALRRIDETGLERLREQRRALQSEQVFHDVRMESRRAEAAAKRPSAGDASELR